MEKKIIAFSKFLTYMVGGAEKSTFEILKEKKNVSIKLISFHDLDNFGAKNKRIKFPELWSIEYLTNLFTLKKFFYLEYLLNRRRIKKYFRNIDSSETTLYTYAMYAPIAINSFSGKSILFIRSETDLAINKNYHKGLKKYLKYIYMFLEYPAFYIYRKDLKQAINKAEVICNSKYMQSKLHSIYSKKGKLLYPFINEDKLRLDFKDVQHEVTNKGVVFVGDAIIKGLEIAKKIATYMPEIKFYFFMRSVKIRKIEDNIIYMPWQEREVNIYKYANIVIVPSIWEEAYGRVSREAYILEIPVLVSNLGGLPESVDQCEESIVNDYLNIDTWIEAIEKNIKKNII